MAFLELNGLTVHVSSGSFRKTIDRLGTIGRSFNGTLRSTTRALKREYQGSTRRLELTESEALERLLNGEGDVWQFTDLFSSKGQGANTFANATLMGFGADGDPVTGQIIYGESFSTKTGSIAVFPETENLATYRDLEGESAQFTALAGSPTISNDSENFHSGAGCVRIEWDAALDEVELPLLTASPSEEYALSAYIKAVAADPASAITQTFFLCRFEVFDDNGISVFGNFQCRYNQWTRFNLPMPVTSAAGAHNISLRIRNAFGTGGGEAFVIDSVQMELGKFYSAPFVDGLLPAGQFELDFPTYMKQAEVATFNFWARGPLEDSAPNGTWLSVQDTTPVRSEILLSKNATQMQLQWRNDAGSQNEITYIPPTASTFFRDWRMYTVIFNYAAVLPSGRSRVELWVDGVRVGTYDTADLNLLPEISSPTFTSMDFGSQGGTNPAQSYMTDIQLLPYLPTQEMIEGWFTLGDTNATAIGPTPGIRAQGDFEVGDEVIVEAEVGNMPYREFNRFTDGEHQNNGRELVFRLREI